MKMELCSFSLSLPNVSLSKSQNLKNSKEKDRFGTGRLGKIVQFQICTQLEILFFYFLLKYLLSYMKRETDRVIEKFLSKKN